MLTIVALTTLRIIEPGFLGPGFDSSPIFHDIRLSPTVTPMPTPVPPLPGRPVSPYINSVTPDPGVPGTVTLNLSGFYTGKLEYRMYQFNGYRPPDLEGHVPWRTGTIGEPGKLVLHDLDYPATWEFEVRAVDSLGLVGDPRPSYYYKLWHQTDTPGFGGVRPVQRPDLSDDVDDVRRCCVNWPMFWIFLADPPDPRGSHLQNQNDENLPP